MMELNIGKLNDLCYDMLKYACEPKQMQEIGLEASRLKSECVKGNLFSSVSDPEEEVVLEFVQGTSFTKSKKGNRYSHHVLRVGKTFYYYLEFDFYDREGVQQSEPEGVRFKRDLVENLSKVSTRKILGTTRLTSSHILSMGRNLLTKFGKYWNVFADSDLFTRFLVQTLGINYQGEGSYLPGTLFRVHVPVEGNRPKEFSDIVKFMQGLEELGNHPAPAPSSPRNHNCVLL